MDTNKIREALATIERALQMSRLNNECRGEYYDGWCSQALPLVDQIRAELDKAPNVLTDSELIAAYNRAWQPAFEANDHTCVVKGYRAIERMVIERNGYLAPAAGLTVEEAEQIAVDARIELDEISWKSPPISYEKEFRRILKRRLTAAINAKKKP